MKKGKVYFENEVWVYSDRSNPSWINEAYEVQMGTLRMFSRLSLVGYKKKEIRLIYYNWINGERILDNVLLWHLWCSKDVIQFFKDYFYCLCKAPGSVIKFSCFLLCKLVSKLKKGNITWEQ